MSFEVKILPAALDDAQEYVAYIRDQKIEPRSAQRWFDGLTDAILSLGSMPGRCPLNPERASFQLPLRQLHFRSHRIIFYVNESSSEVFVVRIIHGARNVIQQSDIQFPESN